MGLSQARVHMPTPSRPEIAGSGLEPLCSLADLHRLEYYLRAFFLGALVKIVCGLS